MSGTKKMLHVICKTPAQHFHPVEKRELTLSQIKLSTESEHAHDTAAMILMLFD
jgi:hypothetical protein